MADGKPGRPLKNPDASLSKQAQYYRENREKIRAEHQAAAAADPDYWRKRHFKRRYGLALEELQAMLDGQDGKCAACRDPLALGKLAHVDHDHNTGAVRAVLCVWCNQALGSLKESPQRAKALIRYMEKRCTNQYQL